MPDWSATLICPDEDFDGAPLLRREFTLEPDHGPVRRATLHATAHGVFEAFLNGKPVSEDVLTPGWTSYEWRLRYASYDVTDLLQPTSVLGIALGNGWFRGRLGWGGGAPPYGTELGAFAQLEIEFDDGHRQVVVTDENWSAGPSAVLANDLYDGQIIDARRYSDVWLKPGFADDGWTGVHRGELDLATLTPYIGPPVRRQEELAPVQIWTSPAGKTLVDFGQNLVGWLRVRVTGPAGNTIRAAARRGTGARRARRPAVADRQGHRRVHPERRRGRLRTDLHLPRLPLRRGRGLAGRDRGAPGGPGRTDRGRGALRAAAYRGVRVLRRDAQPAAPQRGLGTAGQLPGRADRLPAARRAAGLDRRHRRLRPLRHLPVRRRRLPARLAAGSGR